MAQAPAQGIPFKINNLKCFFGVLDNGDDNVVVLAVEKSIGANDYAWHYQETVDYLMMRFKRNIKDILNHIVKLAVEALGEVFGNSQEPETDAEIIQNAILNSVFFDEASKKLVIK